MGLVTCLWSGRKDIGHRSEISVLPWENHLVSAQVNLVSLFQSTMMSNVAEVHLMMLEMNIDVLVE